MGEFCEELVDDIPQHLADGHHGYLVDVHVLHEVVDGLVVGQQPVPHTHEQFVEVVSGTFGQEFGVGPEGVEQDETALLATGGHAVGQQQDVLVLLVFALAFDLQLPVGRTFGERDHLLEIACLLVDFGDAHTDLADFVGMGLSSVQVLQDVQTLEVVVYLLLGGEWQLCQLEQDFAGGCVGVS